MLRPALTNQQGQSINKAMWIMNNDLSDDEQM